MAEAPKEKVGTFCWNELMVEDVRAAAEKATGLGAEVVVPPADLPIGSFAVIKDPQGAVFSLWQAGEGDCSES